MGVKTIVTPQTAIVTPQTAPLFEPLERAGEKSVCFAVLEPGRSDGDKSSSNKKTGHLSAMSVMKKQIALKVTKNVVVQGHLRWSGGLFEAARC